MTSSAVGSVLGGQDEEAAAEQRIGARGEHGDDVVGGRLGGNVAVLVAQHEIDLGAFGAADPVRLLLLHALRPAVELIEIVEELLRVVGDLEVPLREVALLHLGIAPPATALGDLLVGQNGLAARAPVHRAVATLHQSALPELQEDPLAPAVIFRIACHDGAIPVVGKAHALERFALRVDVGVGPLRRMAVALDGGVFRRKAERVPAHWMKHVEALHLRVARDDIADGVVAHVPQVDIARRIREHLEDVLGRLVGIFADGVEPLRVPGCLDARFNLVRVVCFRGSISCGLYAFMLFPYIAA